MDPKQSHDLVKKGAAVLIDVREHEELQESGIAEGALWMPTSKMDDEDADWVSFKSKLPKDKPIIFYCRSGNRSGRVAAFFQEDGYDAHNMGGFCDWLAAQLPYKAFP
jgi:rhodanese-related sulfurtransferase